MDDQCCATEFTTMTKYTAIYDQCRPRTRCLYTTMTDRFPLPLRRYRVDAGFRDERRRVICRAPSEILSSNSLIIEFASRWPASRHRIAPSSWKLMEKKGLLPVHWCPRFEPKWRRIDDMLDNLLREIASCMVEQIVWGPPAQE